MFRRGGEAEMSNYTTLALVKTERGDVIPVELPFNAYTLETGDIVYLPDKYTEHEGKIVCLATAEPDGDLWTFAMMGTGLSVVRARGYARFQDCKWEDES
jgi:hypothetical protein